MVKTVRDGQKVAPTCPECGCRLEKVIGRYTHFGSYGEKAINGRDAKGCLCKYANCDFAVLDGKWHFIISTQTLNWKPL